LLADEKLKGIACRSVHLGYPAPEGNSFYIEMKILSSAPGTYFMACGWNKGYFGVQELANGKKIILFSVWDSGQNDPKAVEEDKRTKLVHKDEKTRIGRFGGEGTGGQSFYDYDWKIGENLRFLVTSKVEGNRTVYSGHFFHSEQKKWIHMVSFSTITGGTNLKGYYSFVEDFKRDKVSTTFARKAEFFNPWIKNINNDWLPISKANFTADANPVLNIDAGTKNGHFFLITGGDTNNTLKLRSVIENPSPIKTPPADIPK
jgi:hypothetical protein